MQSKDKTLAGIAKENGLSYSSLYAYAKKLGVTRRWKPGVRKATPEMIESIAEKYKASDFLSAKKLATEYGVCYPTIVRWLKKADVDIVKKKTVDEQAFNRAIKYYDEGMSVREAARKARVGKKYTSRVSKKARINSSWIHKT